MDCCDREVTSFVATSGWIDAEVIRDLLMTRSLEPRFGGVEAGPHKIEWLSDNAKYYTAKETLRFAEALGLVPVQSLLTARRAMVWQKPFQNL